MKKSLLKKLGCSLAALGMCMGQTKAADKSIVNQEDQVDSDILKFPKKTAVSGLAATAVAALGSNLYNRPVDKQLEKGTIGILKVCFDYLYNKNAHKIDVQKAVDLVIASNLTKEEEHAFIEVLKIYERLSGEIDQTLLKKSYIDGVRVADMLNKIKPELEKRTTIPVGKTTAFVGTLSVSAMLIGSLIER